jgi:hypothetical protein
MIIRIFTLLFIAPLFFMLAKLSFVPLFIVCNVLLGIKPIMSSPHVILSLIQELAAFAFMFLASRHVWRNMASSTKEMKQEGMATPVNAST